MGCTRVVGVGALIQPQQETMNLKIVFLLVGKKAVECQPFTTRPKFPGLNLKLLNHFVCFYNETNIYSHSFYFFILFIISSFLLAYRGSISFYTLLCSCIFTKKLLFLSQGRKIIFLRNRKLRYLATFGANYSFPANIYLVYPNRLIRLICSKQLFLPFFVTTLKTFHRVRSSFSVFSPPKTTQTPTQPHIHTPHTTHCVPREAHTR